MLTLNFLDKKKLLKLKKLAISYIYIIKYLYSINLELLFLNYERVQTTRNQQLRSPQIPLATF